MFYANVYAVLTYVVRFHPYLTFGEVRVEMRRSPRNVNLVKSQGHLHTAVVSRASMNSFDCCTCEISSVSASGIVACIPAKRTEHTPHKVRARMAGRLKAILSEFIDCCTERFEKPCVSGRFPKRATLFTPDSGERKAMSESETFQNRSEKEVFLAGWRKESMRSI